MNYRKNYIILIGIFGTVFEWLEYSYYGYLSTKISTLFFPQYDPRAALLATFGIFAAGFIMRPIGSILFGYIGDRAGRKYALLISIFLMSVATLLMGCVPTYQSIGIYASFLLLCCRLLQGLAVSGEFNGAAIFLIEHNRNRFPSLAGSWVATASALGMLLGALAATIVNSPNMPVWAWRVPFFCAFISCLIVNFLRYKLLETPLFIEAYKQRQLVKFPLVMIFKKYKASFFSNLFLAALVSVYIYICNVYFVTYLIKYIHLSTTVAISLAIFGQLFVVIFSPLAGLFADYYGGKIVMINGLLLALFVTPLLFYFARMQSIVLLAAAQALYGIADAFAFAPLFYYLYKFFPTQVRYTGNSTAWSLGAALFGSTAPLFAEYMISKQYFYGPVIYVSSFIIIAMIIVTKKVNVHLRYHETDSVTNPF